jgi:hypothetical protein
MRAPLPPASLTMRSHTAELSDRSAPPMMTSEPLGGVTGWAALQATPASSAIESEKRNANRTMAGLLLEITS